MDKMRFEVRGMILAALFCALMTVGAKLRIPFPLVALTFQPFFAVLAGLLLGASNALLSMTVYLLMGLVGLPVFADAAAGPEYVLRPTFGFLIGFALAAWVVGRMTERMPQGRVARPATVFGAAGVGLLLIYVVGILYLYAVQTLYAGASVTLAAIAAGMLPFFLKDAVMFLLASVLALRLMPLVRRPNRRMV